MNLPNQGFADVNHGPPKLKGHRATMDHKVEWFDQYMFRTSVDSNSAQK